MSTLDSARLHELRLDYSKFGAWRFDGTLESGAAPAEGSAVTLTIGDLVLRRGTIVRAGLDAPSRPRVVVQGGIGWERTIARPLVYQQDAGVRLRTVIKDLARLAGEPVELPTDAPIGTSWGVDSTRAAAPVRLRDALAALAREGHVQPWRVDPDGTTRFGARVGVPATSRAIELGRNAAVGVTIEGIDSPLAFMPGNSIGGVEIVRLVVIESSGKIRAELWA